MSRPLTAADRADLRDLVHILAGLLNCEGPHKNKMCSKCRRVLPPDQFTRDRAQVDGLAYRCRRCRKQDRARRKTR